MTEQIDLSQASFVDFSKPLTNSIKKVNFTEVKELQRWSFIAFNSDNTLSVVQRFQFNDSTYGSFLAPKDLELQKRCIEKYGTYSRVFFTLVAVTKLTKQGFPTPVYDAQGQIIPGAYETEIKAVKLTARQLETLNFLNQQESLKNTDIIVECEKVQFKQYKMSLNFMNPKNVNIALSSPKKDEFTDIVNKNILNPELPRWAGVFIRSDENIRDILDGKAEVPAWKKNKQEEQQLNAAVQQQAEVQPPVGFVAAPQASEQLDISKLDAIA